MKHLDLFSGIGGFALAARNVGWETVGFCEIDPYCQKVLARHWPGVPIYEDVRDVTAERLRADGVAGAGTGKAKNDGNSNSGGQSIGSINAEASGLSGLVITGGFPCQDISHAGKQAGIDGERSGLWSELARIIGEVRPRYAVLENVAALLSGDSGRWFQRVLGDLAEIGYDCEWHCIPASAVGAPHQRDRVWIIAYPCDVADTDQKRLQGQRPNGNTEGWQGPILGPAGLRHGASNRQRWWAVEPDVGRVANGVPRRVDRLRGLGNAIVPQVAEVIFRAIQGVRYE